MSVLLCAAERLDDMALAIHPAFERCLQTLPPVLELDAPVSPMLAGLLHPVLLLPRHIRRSIRRSIRKYC